MKIDIEKMKKALNITKESLKLNGSNDFETLKKEIGEIVMKHKLPEEKVIASLRMNLKGFDMAREWKSKTFEGCG